MTTLKPFQQKTVETVLEAFFDKDGSRRFLIADEVGLGKTVVAQEVIRRMMREKRGPLVVFYVCSNLSIANQNRRKIIEILGSETEGAVCRVDRLTLMPAAVRPTHPKLHLYTLTPATSIPVRPGIRRDGRQEERALIHALMEEVWPDFLCERGANFFQRYARKDWTWWVGYQRKKVHKSRRLRAAFRRSVRREFDLKARQRLVPALRSIKSDLSLIAHFRNALAASALEEIKPNLVIFDEFQRFRDLVNPKLHKAAARVIGRLRGDDMERPPALLLLSATPYRLYSRRWEDTTGAAHHKEFFDLIEFLYRNEKVARQKRETCKVSLEALARELRRGRPSSAEAQAARDRVQEILCPVIARTERASCQMDGSETRFSHLPAELIREDLEVYRHLSQSFSDQHRSSAVHFWTSIPLPMQTMGSGYTTWKEASPVSAEDLPALHGSERDQFRHNGEWPHPRLRALQKEAISTDLLALPWMPPSLPWWTLDGAWKTDGPAPTKLLIFSRFQAVPLAVAALLSYDLERSLFADQKRLEYADITRRKALQPRADRHALLSLFNPWPWLIASTDPLTAGSRSLIEIRQHLCMQIKEALEKLESHADIPDGPRQLSLFGGPVKQGSRRTIWQLLAQIEARAGNWPWVYDAWMKLRSDPEQKKDGETKDSKSSLGDLLPRWAEEAGKPLGTVTHKEIKDLAEYALSAPGVVLGRALKRHWDSAATSEGYGITLETAWSGLRTYLDQRWFFAALKGRDDETYPDAIRQAVIDGNLEAVLDEHLWVIGQIRSLQGTDLATELRDSLRLRTSVFNLYQPGDKSADNTFSLRCHVALPFTQRQMQIRSDRADDGQREIPFRPDELRRSFNSPFWPHVLTTTSVGQEGLDFHVWCKGLVHWDLCSNPVDLEQREGRIQRYGGLGTRQVIASRLGKEALHSLDPGESPWFKLAELADQHLGDDSGLAPWWVCDGAEIERYVFDVPLSEQEQRLQWVQEQRLLYRLVLGQPNQEDLVEVLSRQIGQNDLDSEDLRQAMLQLSPWFGSPTGQ